MNTLKKATVFVLALVLILSCSIAASAASITIGNAQPGQTYKVYKMFDVTATTPAEGEKAQYSYKVVDAWAPFFEANHPGHDYIELTNGYPTNIKFTTDSTEAAAFAKAALAWAKQNRISSVDSVTAQQGVPATISNLADGYYLVETSLGALCGLNTANGDTAVTINEKNEMPVVKKEVKEKNPSDRWQTSNIAQVGSIVDFKAEIEVKSESIKYVFHDEMEAGLKIQNTTANPITVKVGLTAATVGADYTLQEKENGFDITFQDSYIQKNYGKTITVTYYAMVTKEAVKDTDGVRNEAWLDVGNKTATTHQQTHTNSLSFDLVKYREKANSNEKVLLAGAKFKLYTAETGGEEVPLIQVTEENETYYRPTVEEETATEIVTTANAPIRIKGLNNVTYYLEETEAPNGFNKLAGRTRIALTDNILATKADTAWYEGGVQVENESGTVLPSTGGMGTTLFYVVGGLLMAAAAVLLIAKKRMGKNA